MSFETILLLAIIGFFLFAMYQNKMVEAFCDNCGDSTPDYQHFWSKPLYQEVYPSEFYHHPFGYYQPYSMLV